LNSSFSSFIPHYARYECSIANTGSQRGAEVVQLYALLGYTRLG